MVDRFDLYGALYWFCVQYHGGQCIDWKAAARDLQVDYTEVDFDGVSYWIRCG